MFILLNANKMNYLQCLEKKKSRPIEAIYVDENVESDLYMFLRQSSNCTVLLFLFSKQNNQRATASQRDHIREPVLFREGNVLH